LGIFLFILFFPQALKSVVAFFLSEVFAKSQNKNARKINHFQNTKIIAQFRPSSGLCEVHAASIWF